jgi:serine phosphatase RsbU (regulator of sigma subunit)
MTDPPSDEIERLREEVGRLQHEVHGHDAAVADLERRLAGAEDELTDLRAVRDALTPPQLPERPGLEVAATFSPATRRVSGDFYLVAEGPDDSTVAVVGDVVGKGEEAARRAAFARTVFASTASYEDDPARLLEHVNGALVERSGPGTEFITAACVTFRPATREVLWACAGHPRPLWLAGAFELDGVAQGVPLGIRESVGARTGSRRIGAGDGVLLYTDGLIEARRDSDLFGVERVMHELAALRTRAPRAVVDHLSQTAQAFAGGPLQDDLCLLALRAAPGD